MGLISKQDVRQYLVDNSADDNPLLLDLAYTDDDLAAAMKSAAREFNSITPYSISVAPDALPDDTNVFFDAITASLLRMSLLQKTRNDITHQAGNVSVQVDSVYIGHLRSLIPLFDERFRKAAFDIKLARNLNDGFGAVG